MTTRASKRLKTAAEKAVVTATTSVSAETSVETSRKKTVVKAAVSVEKTTTTTTKKGDDSKAAWGTLFSKKPKVTADGEKIWPRPKQLPGGLSDEMQEKISAFAAFDGVTKTRTNAAPWKLVAWNVNGLRAVLKKDNTVHLRAYVAQEDPDVLCLSETKIDSEELQKLEDVLPQYEHQYWSSAAKKGYSGTVVFSKTKPLSVKDEIVVENGQPDDEGRFLALEFETFWLVHTYVPNAGQKLERLSYRTEQWDKAMLKMLKELEETKPVVWCGDLNVAHQEIDIHNPKGNKKSAGFTNEERESFSEILENGFVDSFRHFNPDKVQYSYWGYRFNARAQNKGWRLDYFIISKSLLERVESTFVRDSVTGSDHCPVGIELK